MNSCGKTMRREMGLNRHEAKRANHTPKSDAKIRRSGWYRDAEQSSNHRHAVARKAEQK